MKLWFVTLFLQIPVELAVVITEFTSPDLPHPVWYPLAKYPIQLSYIKRIDLTQLGSLRSVLAAYRAMVGIQFAPFLLNLSGLYWISEKEGQIESDGCFSAQRIKSDSDFLVKRLYVVNHRE